MIPLSWLPHLKAPFGTFLFVRDEVAAMLGALWLPHGYRSHTRTTTGTVLTTNAVGFEPGERLMLVSGGGSRRFLVGRSSSEQLEVCRVTPSEVLVKLREKVTAEFSGEHILRFFEGKTGMTAEEDDGKFSEGDLRALR